jgi:hypothetical protein
MFFYKTKHLINTIWYALIESEKRTSLLLKMVIFIGAELELRLKLVYKMPQCTCR